MKARFKARPYLIGMLPSFGLSIWGFVSRDWMFGLWNISVVLFLLLITEVIIRKARKMGSLPLAKVNLKRSTAEVPILAYKVAHLFTDSSGKPHLHSKFSGIRYDGGDRAVCLNVPSHDAPLLQCSCGFYAMKSRELMLLEMESFTSIVLLEVELFGRVIVAEQGYRAERQRILHVDVPHCFYCGAKSEGLRGTDGGPLMSICSGHPNRPVRYPFERLADLLAIPVGPA